MDLPDEAATRKLGGRLAASLPKDPGGWMILLRGELGAGKSTLARAVLRALGHEGNVPSPTYTLVEPYQIGAVSAYHVDLYRVTGASELEFLGFSDLCEGLVLIEWPERAEGLTEQGDLLIDLCYSGDGRTARVFGISERGRAAIKAVLL
ncbi:MAG: tRNA (adenosine(37)-N6)-threonylcarbamoyltransferase complex ATPase subunit type 1 TsaE [Gammaproteobacteria bacterium]